jgi:hypothetical protein
LGAVLTSGVDTVFCIGEVTFRVLTGSLATGFSSDFGFSISFLDSIFWFSGVFVIVTAFAGFAATGNTCLA